VVLATEAVFGGMAVMGSVALQEPAPAGGAVVTLSSSNPVIGSVPTSVTAPAGAMTADFTVATRAVSASATLEISASYAGVTRTGTLQVLTLTVASVTPQPN